MVRRIASVTEETYLCDEVYVVVDVNQENRACWMYLKLFQETCFCIDRVVVMVMSDHPILAWGQRQLESLVLADYEKSIGGSVVIRILDE